MRVPFGDASYFDTIVAFLFKIRFVFHCSFGWLSVLFWQSRIRMFGKKMVDSPILRTVSFVRNVETQPKNSLF